MAETALQIIKDAMSVIQVFPDESNIESSETELIKRRLNRMMSRWEWKGIKLGFTEINSTSEYLSVPDGALDAIIYNLAIQIAPDFLGGQGVSLEVKERADESMRDLMSKYVVIGSADMPDTLPTGSGNNRRLGRFYG